MSKVVLGFDPGLDGGVAAITTTGAMVDVAPMPIHQGKRRSLDARALADWLYEVESDHQFVLAVVEQVHARPKQGVASVFSFGAGYGVILGVLGALKVPVELVSPQTWKRVVLRDTARDKAAAIAYCRRRWPGTYLVPPRRRVAHDGMADALCLAEFGRRRVARDIGEGDAA